MQRTRPMIEMMIEYIVLEMPQLYEILQTKKFKFEFVKVKGHSGIKYNEMVDKAAKSAILRLNAKSFPSGGTAK